jgi:hypothetical protein
MSPPAGAVSIAAPVEVFLGPILKLHRPRAAPDTLK